MAKSKKAVSELTAADRILAILRRLMRRGSSVTELATIFQVTDKSIRRDLATIKRAGFRLRAAVETRGRKRYRVLPVSMRKSNGKRL
jgi:DeoR/GlpR family transcriptional regulator of sugar metabolism